MRRCPLIWIREVESPTANYDSLADSGAYGTLDIALATEISRIAKGNLGRTITRTVDMDAQRNVATRGRQLLWLIYDYNRVNEEAGAFDGCRMDI